MARISGYNCVKGLRVIKIVNKIKFKGIWSKLEAKFVFRDCFQNFLLLFISFLAARHVKNSHI